MSIELLQAKAESLNAAEGTNITVVECSIPVNFITIKNGSEGIWTGSGHYAMMILGAYHSGILFHKKKVEKELKDREAKAKRFAEKVNND